MTLAPAVLVLAVGSEIIRTNMDRWFTAPMDEVLAAANELVGDYRRERQAQVNRHAERVARGLVSVDLTAQDQRTLRDRLLSDLALSRDITLQVYRVAPLSGSESELVPVFDVAGNTLPVGYSRDTADRLAAKALTGADELRVEQRLADDTALLHAAATVNVEDGRPVGVVVATDVVTGAIVARSRQMTSAYEQVQPIASAQASADWGVSVVLLDGHAHDSRRRAVDGGVSGETHHAASAAPGGGGSRDWRWPPGSADLTRERRRARRAGGGV